MPVNSALTPSTEAALPRSTESNRQISQPNPIDFAIKHDKRLATIWKIKVWFGGNKNPTIFSWDLMELLADLSTHVCLCFATQQCCKGSALGRRLCNFARQFQMQALELSLLSCEERSDGIAIVAFTPIASTLICHCGAIQQVVGCFSPTADCYVRYTRQSQMLCAWFVCVCGHEKSKRLVWAMKKPHIFLWGFVELLTNRLARSEATE